MMSVERGKLLRHRLPGSDSLTVPKHEALRHSHVIGDPLTPDSFSPAQAGSRLMNRSASGLAAAIDCVQFRSAGKSVALGSSAS